jgi:rhodanese-related sulfurtransferase
MVHTPGFLNLVNDAKKRINEISVAEARARLGVNSQVVLLDVREDHEWQAGHAAEAVHLGKGILERDLEKLFPDPKTEIIMYCGGGFCRGMVAAGWPMKSGD